VGHKLYANSFIVGLLMCTQELSVVVDLSDKIVNGCMGSLTSH
jgi:hypothetical protein